MFHYICGRKRGVVIFYNVGKTGCRYYCYSWTVVSSSVSHSSSPPTGCYGLSQTPRHCSCSESFSSRRTTSRWSSHCSGSGSRTRRWSATGSRSQTSSFRLQSRPVGGTSRALLEHRPCSTLPVRSELVTVCHLKVRSKVS